MARIAYRKSNGRASDIRFVRADYVLLLGEIEMQGDVLPSAESLSDPTPIAEIKAVAKERIDAAAGRARARYATWQPFQAEAYERKAKEADDFIALPAPRPVDAAVGSFLESRLLAMRVSNPAATATDAANNIRAQRDAWADGANAILKRSERSREIGKAKADAAADKAAVDAALNQAIAELDAL